MFTNHTQPHFSVRDLETQDFDRIADYWLLSDLDYLHGIGVDVRLLPSREDFFKMLAVQMGLSFEKKQSYCKIWVVDGIAVGHCNINNIVFGQSAFMHLHIWQPANRRKGCGMPLLQLTIPHFFTNYHLCELYCEPYALNPAPHVALARLGFSLIKEYVCIPGNICFKQSVKLWRLTLSDYNVRFSVVGKDASQ